MNSTIDERLSALAQLEPSYAEKRFESICQEELLSRFVRVPKKTKTWTQLFWVVWTLTVVAMVKMISMGLRKMGLMEEEKQEFLEIIKDELFVIRFDDNLQSCTVIKNEQNEILLFQPPKPTKRVIEFVEKLGSLTTIICPDKAHDANSRLWKKLMPTVTFVTNKQYYDLWHGRLGDSSFIDVVFDLSKTNDVSPIKSCAALRSFGFVEHISAASVVEQWQDYAHLIVLPLSHKRIVLTTSGFAHTAESGWKARALGFPGLRIIYHSVFMYLSDDLTKVGCFWRRLMALKPDLVLFRQGTPVAGSQMGKLHASLDFLGVQLIES